MTGDDLFEKISLLTIRKGDVLILRCETPTPDHVKGRMHDSVRKVMHLAGHGDVLVMILDQGVSLEVLRRDAGKINADQISHTKRPDVRPVSCCDGYDQIDISDEPSKVNQPRRIMCFGCGRQYSAPPLSSYPQRHGSVCDHNRHRHIDVTELSSDRRVMRCLGCGEDRDAGPINPAGVIQPAKPWPGRDAAPSAPKDWDGVIGQPRFGDTDLSFSQWIWRRFFKPFWSSSREAVR